METFFTNKVKFKVGVVVARMQVPYLHDGHKAIINEALLKSDFVLFVVGDTGALSDSKDPLSVTIRTALIKKYVESRYPALKMHYERWWGFCSNLDNESDLVWSKNLDILIRLNIEKLIINGTINNSIETDAEVTFFCIS